MFLLCGTFAAWAGVGGSISGTVTDSTGAVIAKASVRVTNVDTGVQQTVTSDEKGLYSFLNLSIGHYTLAVSVPGFRPYARANIAIDVNSALLIDPVLELGEKKESVQINDTSAQVETASSQLGEVITGTEMTAVPLNGRSYTDLLALQPGVAPVTSITSETVQDVGASALSPSGDLNPGTISINGQREFANSFLVNGSDVEEDVNMGAAIVPNLDSIAEFRILTNNFDAEYGEFSGGQINVVTKSGTNELHGNLFEFVRNPDLDSKNFFSPDRGAFDQNQFGGTVGGPIRKDKIFFFGDYQGTRSTQGVDTAQIAVPSDQDRLGNLLDLASSFVTTNAGGRTVPTTVSGPYFASLLSSKLGYAVAAGEPYYTPGCTSATCVFPGAMIPQSAWSAPAMNLLKYIPPPNNPDNTFSSSAFNLNLRDDKGAY